MVLEHECFVTSENVTGYDVILQHAERASHDDLVHSYVEVIYKYGNCCNTYHTN